jgi:hypothetical protein
VNKQSGAGMRFIARSWPIVGVIGVGLGTSVHWIHRIAGPLVFVEDTTTGQPQENAGTNIDGSANSVDEALRADHVLAALATRNRFLMALRRRVASLPSRSSLQRNILCISGFD